MADRKAPTIEAFNFAEVGKVGINLHHLPVGRYADPAFNSFELTPDEARALAGQLAAAADEVDKFNAHLDEYFRTHPQPPNNPIDGAADFG
jgi:hypothetical protein